MGRLRRLSVHGNDEARETLLGSTYAREWFDPIMAPEFLRRGAYVIEQGTFDWESHLGDRYVPSRPPSTIPGAWQPQDELFVPFRHSDGHIIGVFSVGDPASGLRLSDEELDVLVAATSQAAVLVEAAQATANWERSQTALTELLTDLVAPARVGLGRSRCSTSSAARISPRSGSTRCGAAA